MEHKATVNSNTLDLAVLTKTPREVAEICKRLTESENSCRALGLACRFRGMEYVKALVENGATFKYTKPENNMGGFYTIYYWLSPLEMSRPLRRAYFTNSDTCFSNEVQLTNSEGKVVKTLSPLPIEQRAEIVRYLCENKERVLLEPGELLFYSIISGSEKITAVLKKLDVTFAEKRITQLTESGRSFEWMEFCNMLGGFANDDELIKVLTGIVNELGGKVLHFTDSIYWENYNPYRKVYRMFKPEFFKFVLENFNQKKMNKTKLMKGAINENSVECLAICAENDWLKQPRKRDEMIEYASKSNKTECTAWLLDFKSRTADLAAELVKADKKAKRELNADPNSMTEQKKIWSFEKQDDGTLIITRYKGKRTEAEVPAMIGKSAVTAIGEYAFSPRASRITGDQRNFRETITKIKLPDSIRSIGKGAFLGCKELTELNIPDGVTGIGESAFAGCGFTELVIPDSAVKMGYGLFAGCIALQTVKLPESTDEISDYMFSNCKSLKNITLPSSIQSIGKWAFNRCASLEEIVIPEGVAEIRQQAFMNCDSLKKAVIPASVSKMKNYTYRGHAPETVFHDCGEITAIVEPKSYAEKYCKRNNINYIYKEPGD